MEISPNFVAFSENMSFKKWFMDSDFVTKFDKQTRIWKANYASAFYPIRLFNWTETFFRRHLKLNCTKIEKRAHRRIKPLSTYLPEKELDNRERKKVTK